MQETRVRSLGREDPLEKEMATHTSILAWKIPWTEDPGRLQLMGSQTVRHDWATSLHFRKKWKNRKEGFWEFVVGGNNSSIIFSISSNPHIKKAEQLESKTSNTYATFTTKIGEQWTYKQVSTNHQYCKSPTDLFGVSVWRHENKWTSKQPVGLCKKLSGPI